MEGPKEYWWVGVIVAVVVALIGILPAIIASFKRRKQKRYVKIPSPEYYVSVSWWISSPEGSIAPAEDKKTLTKTPVISSIDSLSEENELYREVLLLKEDGAYNEALRKLDKLISMRSDYVNAYIIRGRIYLENLKQYQNAMNEFCKGLEKDPHNKYLLYDLGLAYYFLGDLIHAINWNQKALDQDPDLIMAIYNHAIYHVTCGKKYKDDLYYLKAIELYENVIGRDLEFAVNAMFNLAALYARLARQEKNKSTRDQYVDKVVELLDRAIEKEGLERLKKVTGEIVVPYGEDLNAIYQDPKYKRMIKKWKDRFTK